MNNLKPTINIPNNSNSNDNQLTHNNNFISPLSTESGVRQRAQSVFKLNTPENEYARRAKKIAERWKAVLKEGPLVNLTSKHPYNTGRPKRNIPSNKKNTIRAKLREPANMSAKGRLTRRAVGNVQIPYNG